LLEAVSLGEEAVTASRETGIIYYISNALLSMSRSLSAHGRHELAAERGRECMELAAGGLMKALITQAAITLALALQRREGHEPAAVLYGVAAPFLESTGARMHPIDAEQYRRGLDEARDALGRAIWSSCLARGKSLPLDEALRLAQEAVCAIHQAGGLLASRSPLQDGKVRYPAGLSRREVQVLRLAARGHTDPEIAEKLVLSPNTVHAHMRNIYQKIGATNRAAAIRFAIDHGIVS
jgi:DNA-binding CsgD family transcriptional regulator